MNQQANPLLSAQFQRDPCIQSVFISKQSIKETGSDSVSPDQIDVVQTHGDSGPLGNVCNHLRNPLRVLNVNVEGPVQQFWFPEKHITLLRIILEL